MANTPIGIDQEGYNQITDVLKDLMNAFPGLSEGETFKFSTVDSADDKAWFPSSGAMIMQERESITGHVWQMCAYPFTVVYRASGLKQKYKISVKEWLDDLGRWLTRQPVFLDGVAYQLDEYPELTSNRKIKNIQQQNPAYLMVVNEDKSEDWILMMSLTYENEFDR